MRHVRRQPIQLLAVLREGSRRPSRDGSDRILLQFMVVAVRPPARLFRIVVVASAVCAGSGCAKPIAEAALEKKLPRMPMVACSG